MSSNSEILEAVDKKILEILENTDACDNPYNVEKRINSATQLIYARSQLQTLPKPQE
jgi:hypothetical protein